ncbi:MAG: hypothetical protein ACKO9H_04190 [Planctomycetota bacterium]
MRYESLSEPYHAGQRDFGFRDMPITVLLLQRRTLLSLIELRVFSVECMRVLSNHADRGCFDTNKVFDWEHAESAFNQFFNSELCLENLIQLADRGWVEDLFGGRHKLLVEMRSVDDLLFDYDQQTPWPRTAEADGKECS